MKKIIITFAIALTSFLGSFASNPPTLINEIKQKVTVSINNVNLTEYDEQSYLALSFKILNGKVKLYSVKGSSNSKLKRIVLNKLIKMNINSSYEEGKLYNLKFNFKK